jgi:hypothetical protein
MCLVQNQKKHPPTMESAYAIYLVYLKTGLNLYPYIRLGPRLVGESNHPLDWLSGSLVRSLFTRAGADRSNAGHGTCTGGRDPRTPPPTPALPGSLAAA